MEILRDPETFVGEMVNVTPDYDDNFHEFVGKVIGVRNGFLKVKDQDDNVFEVEINQVSIA